MKKMVALALALITIFLCACAMGSNAPAPGGGNASRGAASPEPEAEPLVTPVPTPTPKPTHIGIFLSPGSDGGADAFSDAIQARARERGMTTEALKAAASEGFDAIVVFAAPGFDYASYAENIPEETAVVVYASGGVASPTSVVAGGRFSLLYYEDGYEIDALYESALTYPPHDTPVRLIGLFENKESPAAQRLQELYMEGKALPKALYYADDEGENVSKWMKGVLDGFVEGTADGIVAENAELGLAALRAMKLEGRKDMEIFCVGLTGETSEAIRDNPEVFVAAVGASMKQMGEQCFDVAMLCLGGEGGAVLGFAPAISDEVKLRLAAEGFGIAQRPEPTPESSPSPS